MTQCASVTVNFARYVGALNRGCYRQSSFDGRWSAKSGRWPKAADPLRALRDKNTYLRFVLKGRGAAVKSK